MNARESNSLVTLAEAAAIARVSVATLRRRIGDGTVPAFRRARRIFVDRAAAARLGALVPLDVASGSAAGGAR